MLVLVLVPVPVLVLVLLVGRFDSKCREPYFRHIISKIAFLVAAEANKVRQGAARSD